MASSLCNTLWFWHVVWSCCSPQGKELTQMSMEEVLRGAGAFLPDLGHVTGHICCFGCF